MNEAMPIIPPPQPPSFMQTPSQSWIERITQQYNFDTFLKRFNLTTALVVEVLLFFGSGVVAGFLAKRYLRQLIFGIIAFFLIIKGLEYAGVSTVFFNWERVKELTGVTPTDTLSGIIQAYVAWIRVNIVQVISATLGFVVGFKLS